VDHTHALQPKNTAAHWDGPVPVSNHVTETARMDRTREPQREGAVGAGEQGKQSKGASGQGGRASSGSGRGGERGKQWKYHTFDIE
jgi:hypothetical protein